MEAEMAPRLFILAALPAGMTCACISRAQTVWKATQAANRAESLLAKARETLKTFPSEVRLLIKKLDPSNLKHIGHLYWSAGERMEKKVNLVFAPLKEADSTLAPLSRDEWDVAVVQLNGVSPAELLPFTEAL